MSYWWHGAGGGVAGGGYGPFWDGTSTAAAAGDAWGQPLSEPFDQSQLPGAGTRFHSHAEQAAARHDQMVQTSMQTAADQQAAQTALGQGNTAAVAALVN